MQKKENSLMTFLVVKNQKVNYVVTILLWVAAIVIWALPQLNIPWLFVALIAMHLSEIFICGVKIGHSAGVPLWKCLLMCLLFGFFWWLPIKMNMKNTVCADESVADKEEKN